MSVDFHQHVWTDEFRRALEERTEPPLLRGGRLVLPEGGAFEVLADAYTPEARLDELDAAGIDVAIVSLAPSTEPTLELAEIWNDSAAGLAAESNGRLIPLAYRETAAGFAGAIVAAPQLRDLDALAELLDRLETSSQILFVHPGPAPAGKSSWWAAGVAYTAQMQEAYAAWIVDGGRRWPALQVVFALLGGGAAFQVERLVRRGLDAQAPFPANLWFETSSYGERALELSFRTFGAGRLLFGSDAPIDSIAIAREALARLGASLENELVEVNPSSLLPRVAVWAA
jgi:hypothetical protein